MSEWRAGVGRDFPAAWLSLDKDDNDPVRFLNYLTAALGTIKTGLGKTAAAQLQSPQISPPHTILTNLINEIVELGTPFTLALEDYHLVVTQPVHDILVYLLDHQPPQMHLVILTRADPPLPLARLRARGQLTEIRATHLQFTASETSAFLNEVMGLNLSPQEVSALEVRTEGWIAGLQLAALAMRGHEEIPDFISAFTEGHHYIADYLVDEVLTRQSEPIREFLLQTSILERLSGPLCDGLTGHSDSQAILEELYHANLFVYPMDDQVFWYRYHHLFADVLRQQLSNTRERYKSEILHQRAGAWYETNGFIDEAITHALAGLDYNHTADLIERYAFEYIYRSQTVLVHRWLEALPEDFIRSRPILGVIQAWVLMLGPTSCPRELIEKQLQQIETVLSDQSRIIERPPEKSKTDQRWITSQVATIRASLTQIFDNDYPATVKLLQKTISCLPEQEIRMQGILYNNLGVANLAINSVAEAEAAFTKAKELGLSCDGHYTVLFAVSYLADIALRQGHLHLAKHICQEVLRSQNGSVSIPEWILPIHGAIYVILGIILLERNSLQEADPLISRGVELIQLSGELEILVRGYACLARLRQAQGDLHAAFQLLERARNVWPDVNDYIDAVITWLNLEPGNHNPQDLQNSLQWARDHYFELEATDEIPDVIPRGERSFTILLTVSRVLITYRHLQKISDLQPVHQFIKRQLHFAELRGWRERVIELSILEAMACQADQADVEALLSLQRAVELAESEGYIRIFVEWGEPMKKLLMGLKSKLQKHDIKQPLRVGKSLFHYIQQLLSAFPVALDKTTSVINPQSWVELLSKRELDVLRLIADGCSNKEIASRLYITIGTVKRHTGTIFQKLDVENRTQAVAQARELKLL